ncbi:gag-protease polyprotein, partial [Trifolium medium]|nr:gag-protease polyprotein [Trifolium medium]
TRNDEKASQPKGVQCHECEGYDHIRTECATYLKKQKKSLVVSWSDEDDSEEEVDSETAKHVRALTCICMADEESHDEEVSYDELAASYKETMHQK